MLSHNYTGTFEMRDLSPSAMLAFATRIKTDQEMSAMFDWCTNGKAHSDTPPKTSAFKLMNYCNLVSSEMHEWSECALSGGEKNSAYGIPFGLNEKNGWLDRIIKSWINVDK